MKTTDERFYDAFFSGEYDPELYAEFFGLQDQEKTDTQTQTKTVKKGIYTRVSTGEYVGNIEQFRTIKTGEQVNNYTFEVIDANTLRINGNAYRVEDNSEFAIKVMKTKIKANGGANGLVKFFMHDNLDSWELKVIENCKSINLN